MFNDKQTDDLVHQRRKFLLLPLEGSITPPTNLFLFNRPSPRGNPILLFFLSPLPLIDFNLKRFPIPISAHHVFIIQQIW